MVCGGGGYGFQFFGVSGLVPRTIESDVWRGNLQRSDVLVNL